MRVPRHVLVAAIIPLATLALYAYGAALTPPGKSFTWMHALNAGDPHAYLSWVAQARDGDVLFRDLFTEERCAARLFHPLFLAMGCVARVARLPLMAVYHASRVVLGALFLLVLGRFFARRTPRPGTAFFALLYAVLGSGLGWIFVRSDATAMHLPVDLWMPEAILFLTILESPLNLAALTAAVVLIERIVPAPAFAAAPASVRPEPAPVAAPAASFAQAARGFAAPFGLTLFLGFTHPFEIVSLGAIAAAVALLAWARRRVSRAPLAAPPAACGAHVSGLCVASLAAFAAGAGLAALYVQLALRGEPVFAHWLATARSPSPAPAMYLLAFAPQLALALLALPRRWARGGAADLLPIAWVLATALLLYAPLAQQRRFIAGAQIPLALLAAEGLCDALPRLAERMVRRARALGPLLAFARRRRVALAALFLAASFATNARVVAADVDHFRAGAYPLYLERALTAALDEFAARSPRDALLLASPEVSHFVPALTGRRATMGHYDMTVDPARKAERLAAFLDASRPPERRRALLDEAGITHVLVSPYEASFAGRDPAALVSRDALEFLGPDAIRLGLAPVSRSGPVTLFEVVRRVR